MVLVGYSGARGTKIYEENLKAKISRQTPFKIHFPVLAFYVNQNCYRT